MSSSASFKQYYPCSGISNFIECYWTVQDNSPIPGEQKVIPDGYPEVIAHYGDRYRIKIDGRWKLQSRFLVGGQLTKHFFLRNTGRSDMFGIKFRPTGLAHLFGVHMDLLTDKVISVTGIKSHLLTRLNELLAKRMNDQDMVTLLDNFFLNIVSQTCVQLNKADTAVDLILKSNGSITVNELCVKLGIGDRQLQLLFKRYVGLSPKFYARVIRFNYVFQLMKNGNPTWCDITYESGFFDQSHFIKNFQAFTGEDPSNYGFKVPNMANFFLNRK